MTNEMRAVEVTGVALSSLSCRNLDSKTTKRQTNTQTTTTTTTSHESVGRFIHDARHKAGCLVAN